MGLPESMRAISMALSRRSGVRQNHNLEICFKAVRTHFSEFEKAPLNRSGIRRESHRSGITNQPPLRGSITAFNGAPVFICLEHMQARHTKESLSAELKHPIRGGFDARRPTRFATPTFD